MKRIGKLRFLVTIENPTVVIDGTGSVSQTWASAGQAWADIQPVSGLEEWRNNQIQLRATHRIAMRYRSDLTAKSRLRYGTRIWNISRIRNLEESNDEIELYAWEENLATWTEVGT